MLELDGGLNGGVQTLPLLVDVLELVGKHQQVPEELNRQVRITASDLAIGTKRAVKLSLYCVPPLASLVEWMDKGEAVEGVASKIFIVVPHNHFIIGLACKRHEIRKLAKLLQH